MSEILYLYFKYHFATARAVVVVTVVDVVVDVGVVADAGEAAAWIMLLGTHPVTNT